MRMDGRQQCPGDGRALLLPAGEGDAALAHHGFKTLWKLFKLFTNMSCFGSFEQFLLT